MPGGVREDEGAAGARQGVEVPLGGEGVDGTTVVGKGSYEVALLAAGGAIEAVVPVPESRPHDSILSGALAGRHF